MQTKLSLVIPIYNESDLIEELISRLDTLCSNLQFEFEVIIVDDGSSDDSVVKLTQYLPMRCWLSIVELSRNFGHQYAVSAGLNYVTGSLVAILDGDLQDPPELIPSMIEKIYEGYQVVYGIRKSRKENILKRSMYYLFYRVLFLITDIWIPADAGDFCVFTERVLQEIKNIPERNRFLRGIRAWVGFNQIGFPYDRHERHAAGSKYSLLKLVHLALDGIFGFSLKPLRVIFLTSCVVTVTTGLIAGVYIFRKLAFDISPPGFATVVVSILLLGGFQFSILGILGEYIGRIYQEVRQRPLYIVKNVIRSGKINDPHDQ